MLKYKFEKPIVFWIQKYILHKTCCVDKISFSGSYTLNSSSFSLKINVVRDSYIFLLPRGSASWSTLRVHSIVNCLALIFLVVTTWIGILKITAQIRAFKIYPSCHIWNHFHRVNLILVPKNLKNAIFDCSENQCSMFVTILGC